MKTLRTFICALAATLLSAAISSAQGNYRNVVLSIAHNDGRYLKDETVEVWALKLEEDQEPLRLTTIENGVRSKAALELKAGEKTMILSRAYSEPTAVIVQVAPDKEPNTFSAVGFIVAPEEFRPGFEEPADFALFWKSQVKRLRKSKMHATLTPVPSDKEGIESYDLEISMPEGNPVRAYIAWPKDAARGSLPILIVPHGAGVRSSNLKNAVHRALSSHAIVIDINAHGVPNGRDDAFYEALSEGELKDYRTKYHNTPEDSYFRLMYLRMQRVLDYACGLKLWDGKRVALDGTSQGGGQSAALAGLDPRVGFVILQVPALTDMGGKLAGHGGSWPYYGKFDDEKFGDWKRALPYYDAANFLRYYNGILWMEAGLIDTTCPPECVFAAYNVAASAQKHIAAYPYRHHGEKRLWEDNYTTWRETILQPRKDALDDYLKAGAPASAK